MKKSYPGGSGPDPTNHHKLSHAPSGPTEFNPHDQGTGRSVAAADVALNHMAHGSQLDSGFNEGLPPQAQAPDRGPPKHGPNPAPLRASMSHHYGHQPSQRQGHLRMSGHPGAHQVGRKR